MRLTIYTDYSLRLLTYLATHRERVCTVGEIAGAYDISKNHLLKVANELAAHGIVEAIRGNRGGLRLAMAPHKISIGNVVRITEPDFRLVACFEDQGVGCLIEAVCVLPKALSEASAAFLKVLDKYTLSDLMVPRPALTTIFETATQRIKITQEA
jgi:Rrf2 family nitric oxide-sensitive transcriptional repressor